MSDEEIASRVHTEPDRGSDYRNDDHGPDHGHDVLRTAAARRVVGGMIEFGSHRFTPTCYRNTARNFSHSVSLSMASALVGEGCAALTGSDAGKLSIRPASSLLCMSRSAARAAAGLSACLSCGAGLNFSAIYWSSMTGITSRHPC